MNLFEDGILSISIMGNKYIQKKKRDAGRRKKILTDPNTIEKKIIGTDYVYETEKIWMYSDVVYMMQSMKDKEIIDRLNVKPATYYRHKKALKESGYYKNLDPQKMNDIEYLKSQRYDLIF